MANKIGVVLALDGEAKFSQGMKNASQSAKNLQSDLKTLKSDFKENANSMEYLKQRQDMLKASQEAYDKALNTAKSGLSHQKTVYKEQQKTLEDLKKELEKAKKAQEQFQEAGDTTSTAYKKSEQAVKKYEKAIEKQSVEIQKSEGKISQWEHTVNQAQHDVTACGKAVDKNSKYLDEAAKSANGCATSIDKYGNEVRQAGDKAEDATKKTKSLRESLQDAIAIKAMDMAGNAISALGQKAIEAGKYVIEVGSTFEASMSKVEALSGATGNDLQALSEKAQLLGRTTQYSASEAADALSAMALAGWNTNEMLDGIDGVLDLAAASGMDLASAADAVAGYLAAFNMKASESGRLADVMATAQAKSKTTADQLAEAYGTCATNLTQAGQEMTTTTALLEGLASVNDTGSAAGTKLSAVMAQITKKMKDGKIAIGDTEVAVTDSSGAFRDMVDIIADVEKVTDGMTDAERASALQKTFNRQSTAGMNELLSVGSEKLAAYKQDLENSSGAAANMASTMQDNLQGALKEANSATEGLGIAMYEKVKGPLTGAVRIATGLINGITDAITPQKTELEAFLDDIEAETERIDALLTAADEDIKKAEGKTLELEAYKNTILELQDVLNNGGELDAFQLYQMQNAVDAVAGEIPEIGENFDAVTGRVRLTKSEIMALFEATEQGVMKQALQNAMQAELQAVADAKINQARAIAAVRKAEEEYNNYLKNNPGMGEYNAAGQRQMTDAFLQLEVNMNSARMTLASTTSEVEKAEAAYNETADAAEILAEKETELERKTGDSATSAENLAKEQRDARNATKEAAAATEEAVAANEDFEESEDTAAQAAEEAQKRVEDAHKSAAEAIRQAYNDAKKAAESAFSINPFKEWEQNEEEGIEKLQQALNSQLEGLENYSDNLQTVAEHVGQEVTPEFMQYLQEMGTEGAQVMQEMAEALESGDSEKVAEIMRTFAQAMDQREEIATAMAANEVALKTGQKAMGSTASEWDNLKSTITEKLSGLGDETSRTLESEFMEAAGNARACGVAIPEGLIEGIESAEDSEAAIQNAIEQINAAAQGQLEGLLEVAKESGAELPKGLEKGIEDGTVDVKEACQALLEALSTAGEESGQAQAQGIEGSTGEVTSAAESVTSEAASAAEEVASEFEAAGAEDASQLASGISSGQGSAVSAAAGVASAAKSAAASYENSFYSVGVAMAQGISSGIQSQVSAIASQAANAVTTAINRAKAAGGINSPSKKFRDLVGKQLGAGLAMGIKQSTKRSEEAAEYQMGKTLAAATKWLKKNAKKIANTGTSLADATSYTWETLGAYEISKNFKISKKKTVTNKKGKKTTKKKGAEEYNSEVYAAAEQYLSNVQALYDTTDQKELKYWQNVAKRLKKGTSAWYDAQKKIKELKEDIADDEAEAAEKAAEAREKAAEEKAEAAEAKAEAAERAAEEKRRKSLAKGGTSWQSLANAEINKSFSVKKNSDAEEYYASIYDAASKYLSNIQTLYTTTDQQELEYWQKVAKRLKEGTTAWYDAQKQIKSLKEQIAADKEAAAEKAAEEKAKAAEEKARQAEEKAREAEEKARQAEEKAERQRRTELAKGGTSSWQTLADAQIKKSFSVATTNKGSEEYYESILSAAEKYLSNIQTLYETTDQQELEYWQKVAKRLKKGTTAWYDAQSQIKSLQKQIADDKAAAAEKAAEEKERAAEEKARQAEEKAKKAAEKAEAAEKAAEEKRRQSLAAANSKTWQSLANAEIKKSFSISKANKDTNAYYESVYSAAGKYLSNVQTLYEITDQQELQYWQNVAKRLKKGTTAWYDAQKQIKSLQKKIADEKASAAEKAAEERQKAAEEKAQALEDKYNKILQQAEEYVQQQTRLNKMSVQSEIAYWQKILKQLKKGSDQYKTVTEKILDLKEQIGTLSVAENLVGNYEVYYTMSERATMQYWAEIRKHYKAGTAERIAADQKYLDAKTAYNEKLKSIEDDYAEKIAETNAKYTDAIESRTAELMGAFDLFEAFESTSATGQELLFNIKSQAAGYEEWQKSITSLQNRGILSESLMKELTDRGPEQIAAIKALMTLTDKELKEYQKAYDQKEAASSAQAKKENQDLKKTVADEVAELKKQRTAELNEVKTGIDTGLLTLAQNIQKISEDQTDALVAAFTGKGSAAAESTGTSVKKETVSNASATSLVTQARTATANANTKSTILSYINAGKARSKTLTASEKKSWSELAQYIVKTYGREPTVAMYKNIAKALGVSISATPTRVQLDTLLKKMKEKGLATGRRSIYQDGLAWIDENLGTQGPEMIVRKSDNAILTRLKAGDSVIPANLTSNLWKWGALDPSRMASGAEMNARILGAWQMQSRASDKSQTDILNALASIISYLPAIAEGMHVNIDGQALSNATLDYTSRGLARKARRR